MAKSRKRPTPPIHRALVSTLCWSVLMWKCLNVVCPYVVVSLCGCCNVWFCWFILCWWTSCWVRRSILLYPLDAVTSQSVFNNLWEVFSHIWEATPTFPFCGNFRYFLVLIWLDALFHWCHPQETISLSDAASQTCLQDASTLALMLCSEWASYTGCSDLNEVCHNRVEVEGLHQSC